MTQDKVTVTQADREAAADFVMALTGDIVGKGGAFRRGECDDYTEVQAFAHHRTTALAAKEAELAELRTMIATLGENAAEAAKEYSELIAAERAKVEKLREALADCLARYDEVVKACPANKTFLGERPCPKCGASSQEGCREENRAAFSFISNARATLAETQPERNPDNG